MNSNTPNPEQVYSEQLSDFEGQLKHTMDDSSLLQDVHRAIRELLKEHRSSEKDIRKILLAQLDSGSLRQESYQLVRTMLDRIVSDDEDTLPGSVETSGDSQYEFHETDVMASDSATEVPAEDRLQIGSVLRDRFLLQEQVAGGSMGVVYKALDRRLAEADTGEPWVAIKVLSPKLSRNGNALRALQQEAAKGRCLTHPNIVRFLDLDRDDEIYFIVMEWLDGRSLADILDDSGSEKLDLQTALDITGQLGLALDYAHRCGVIHADVKPANVMIVASGQAKLFDFGVARIRQKQTETVTRFDPAVLGAVTPAYSSMQVLTGDEPVPADDVFSLACLFYRMIAGYRVFGPRNAAEAAESGMEPQRPQGLQTSQWKALKKALAYSRVARYASMQGFIDDITADQPDEEEPLNVGEPMVDSDDTTSSRRWPLAIAAGALLATIAWIGTQTNILSDFLPTTPAANRPSTADESLSNAADELAATDVTTDKITTITAPPIEEQSSTKNGDSEPKPSLEPLDQSSTDDSILIGDTDIESNGDGVSAEIAADREAVSTTDELSSHDPGDAGNETGLPASAPTQPLPELADSDLTNAGDDRHQNGADLQPNSVGFWLDRVTVRESDPAVQIDVLRLNPDAGAFEVSYSVRDIDATEGEDYFIPSTTIYFAANQHTVRLLIPLVQDALIETDEAFSLEINATTANSETNINRRITVMIQDDDVAVQ